jgi:glutathione S-transferase
MSQGFTLYGRQGAGSLASQILLEEAGADYKMVWVDAAMGESAEYRRIAPTGKIPALVLPDGNVLFESAAICLYLAEIFPAAGLAPAPGSVAHAKFLQWMMFIATSLYGAIHRVYYAPRYSASDNGDGVKAVALAEYEGYFALIEVQLSPYLLGETLSAADIYLFMLASWHPDGQTVLTDRYPKLGALLAEIAARPAVARVLAAQG